jgi:NTP pyrophosphatase (non-canonical NTP hydrolase)
MDQPLDTYSIDAAEFQLSLISEEYWELVAAVMDCETYPDSRVLKEQALKELTDLLVVCFQMAECIGWDLDVAYNRVMDSNMSKLVDGKPLKREDGKVLKGPNYQSPCLIDLV